MKYVVWIAESEDSHNKNNHNISALISTNDESTQKLSQERNEYYKP